MIRGAIAAGQGIGRRTRGGQEITARTRQVCRHRCLFSFQRAICAATRSGADHGMAERAGGIDACKRMELGFMPRRRLAAGKRLRQYRQRPDCAAFSQQRLELQVQSIQRIWRRRSLHYRQQPAGMVHRGLGLDRSQLHQYGEPFEQVVCHDACRRIGHLDPCVWKLLQRSLLRRTVLCRYGHFNTST